MRLERNEAKKLISEFLEKYEELTKQTKRVNDILNCEGCELFEAIFDIANHEIEVIDRLTNNDEWLDWFVTEIECGSGNMDVKTTDKAGNEETRTIKTVDDLLWAMGYDDE